MDIKKFALLDLVEQKNIIILQNIKNIETSDNAVDTMTKSMGRIIYYHHTDTIMGHRVPDSLAQSNPTLGTTSTCSNSRTRGGE